MDPLDQALLEKLYGTLVPTLLFQMSSRVFIQGSTVHDWITKITKPENRPPRDNWISSLKITPIPTYYPHVVNLNFAFRHKSTALFRLLKSVHTHPLPPLSLRASRSTHTEF